jgi:hypothetical protein
VDAPIGVDRDLHGAEGIHLGAGGSVSDEFQKPWWAGILVELEVVR